jgi:S1-C subfamily serine protease
MNLTLKTIKRTNSGQERKETENSAENGKLGLSLQPANPETLKRLGLPEDTEGLVVTEVDPNGAAAEEGIVPGDVIMEINRSSVTSTDDVQPALEKSRDKPIFLLINRKGQTIYLTITPGK